MKVTNFLQNFSIALIHTKYLQTFNRHYLDIQNIYYKT